MLIKSKTAILIGLVVTFILVTITYSNHFHNAFHFDDAHSVEDNVYIRDIKNIPLFFKDGTTSSSLPQNQSYRPVVSASLAIDYWLGNGYNLFYFHLSSFIVFLLQGLLMYLLFKKIFDLALPKNSTGYIALILVAWYLLHPAIAETINYVIARSDLLSTFWLVFGFVLYLYSPFCKKTFLYLLPVGIGALAKPTAVMFAPILFFYILFFEEEMSLPDIFKAAGLPRVWTVVKKNLPTFIFCALTYLLISKLTPKTWEPGGSSPMLYLITQPYVILHYFYTLFVPLDLSADTDWTLLNSAADPRFFLGVLFILLLLAVAWFTSKSQKLRPISFGVLWFFLALIPTSTIIPLAEVMNDHRMFFPFIGLVLSVGWGLGLLLMQAIQKLKEKGSKYAELIITPVILLLPIYAFGTYQRNAVWRTEESLWYDVTIKSPKNGRGLMNYGLVKMGQGDYKKAEQYFNSALMLTPNYSTLYVNLGVLKENTGDAITAENNFKKGIDLGPTFPDTHFLYARFLFGKQRYPEAVAQLLTTIQLSPSHLNARLLLMNIYQKTEDWDKLKQLAENTAAIAPGNPYVLQYIEAGTNRMGQIATAEALVKKSPSGDNYLNLSLLYYQAGQFVQCIEACKEALRLNPNSAEAYNNMGSAYNLLQKYDQAIEVLKKAILLKPDFRLAQNNLMLAQSNKSKMLTKQPVNQPNAADNFINLSLNYYNKGNYEGCVEAAKKALAIRPNDELAYNNICAAYNKLSQWDKAIEAGEKGLKINPKNVLLKNNLAAAYAGKKTK